MELQKMQFGTVTFVLAERILWKLRAKVTHHSVACDLGDYAGGSDAQAEAITVDDCRLRKRKRDNWQAINQNMIGLFEQRCDRKAHGPMAGAEDIDSVDLDRIDNANGPFDLRIADKIAIDFLAQFWRELLGII
jgi:hypothetical protein